ncbi:hypothetical protein FRC07_004692, partial [Ceratobasidium sp. 392]
MVSRQSSSSNLHSFYAEPPPSPKSPIFVKAHHSRRPSFTSWLGRGSGQTPSSPVTKVMQISDPQPTNAYDAAAKAPGALGKGATAVRTPGQALTVSFPLSETPNEKDEFEATPVDTEPLAPQDAMPPTQPLIPRRESPAPVPRRESPVPRRVESPGPMHDFPASARASPIPSGIRSLHTSKSYSHLQRTTTSPLSRNAPLPLNLVSSSRQPLLRSALKPPSPTKPTNGPFLPLLPPPRQSPKETPPATPLAPFHPVLLSGVPNHPVSPSQVIVTIETSTLSQRTTVATLTSRPSRLASYLQALVPSASKEVLATDSSFSSLFAAHLAQAGLVPQTQGSYSGQIHIFLDRPSAPYAHILTYLRASSGTTGVLPRAASLALSTDSARVEALCELRDEARYLELSELAELCDKELRARAPKLRNTMSSSSLRDSNFGNGSEGSGRTGSGEGIEARLKEYRFGEPLKEEEGEDEEGTSTEDQVPPIMYEKKGSHAGIVVTVPPRGLQLTGMKLAHGRAASARIPSSLSGRVRTMSDVRYTP